MLPVNTHMHIFSAMMTESLIYITSSAENIINLFHYSLRPGADQISKAAFGKSAFDICRSVLASTESNLLHLASNKSKSISAHCTSVVVMAEVDEDVAVLLWYCWEILYMGENRKCLWVHPINEKRGKESTLQNFLQELLCDEKKFQNFTRLSLETFDFIVNLISNSMLLIHIYILTQS
jgi:hypothetical protein